MAVFEHLEFDNHEQVVFCKDEKTGLKALIAIHSTKLGPALGGCRMWDYANEEEALTDVLRLSKGMTYKAAVAGRGLGGGKSVIIGDAKKIKSEALFRAFGRFVDSLSGRYLTAEDVNIRVADMAHIAKETKHYTGAAEGSGDPSPVTALGVFHGLRAGVKHLYKQENLQDIKVAIQGCGNVGSYLAGHLHEAGAKLFVCDMAPEKTAALKERYGAEIVGLDAIHKLDVDVYAPCALGGSLNDDSIPEIKAKIVCGGANNQLLDESIHGKKLQEAGILYAPDYVVNAGGIMNCFREIKGYDEATAKEKAKGIYDTTLEVFRRSEEKGITPHEASNEMARERLSSP